MLVHIFAQMEIYSQIAEERGYFAKNSKGETALVDFGEFYCGIVDSQIQKQQIGLKKKSFRKICLILVYVAGWLTLGEYLPTDDVYLANGVDAKNHA